MLVADVTLSIGGAFGSVEVFLEVLEVLLLLELLVGLF